jgi:hypothetical protein
VVLTVFACGAPWIRESISRPDSISIIRRSISSLALDMPCNPYQGLAEPTVWLHTFAPDVLIQARSPSGQSLGVPDWAEGARAGVAFGGRNASRRPCRPLSEI